MCTRPLFVFHSIAGLGAQEFGILVSLRQLGYGANKFKTTSKSMHERLIEQVAIISL